MDEGIRYVAGGTVQAGGGVYLERPADRELLEHCRRGDFVYILTARQLGKSSLMIRTAEALIEEGCLAVVVDLQSVGTPENAEQWYRGLLLEIESQLDLGVDVAKWWRERDDIGYAHRLGQFLREVVVASTEQRVVIFVDEIDTTLALEYTDDFFIAIRYMHEARAQEEALARLSFVLIGVATPSDLIKEGHRTPFNIGSPLEMTDFTAEEAQPLVAGVGTAPEAGDRVLRRVLYWTGGHPYLTLRTFQELHERGSWSEAEVDGCVERLFLGDQTSSDHNIQFVRSMLTDKSPERNRGLASLVTLQRGGRVRDRKLDQAITWLKLSGVVRVEAGHLRVRNQIYRRLFSVRWAKDNRTVDWARRFRQLAAGVVGVAALATMVLVPWFVQAGRTEEALERERQVTAELEEEKGRVEAEKAVAEGNLRRSESLRLATVAESLAVPRYELAGLLAVEAMRLRTDFQEPVDALVLGNLRRFALQGVPLRGHDSVVTAAAFSPDGTLVVTSSADHTVRVWRVDGSGEPFVLRGHDDDVMHLTFSPDGQFVVSTSQDDTARVWRADGSREPIVLRGHTGDVYYAAFSPDGQHVVTASADNSARVWRSDGDGEPVVLGNHPDDVSYVEWSPDGERVLALSDDAQVWRADGIGDPIVLANRYADETDAEWSPDGKLVATASGDWTARVWRADGRGSPVVLRGHASLVDSVAFSPDGTRVVTASWDETARIWQVDGSGEPIVLPHDAEVSMAEWSPDGKLVATISADRTVRVWRADGRGDPVVLRGHESSTRTVRWSPDGKLVVTSSHDATARMWQADAIGDPVVLRGHGGPVTGARFSPDGQHVVTSSHERGEHTARVWRVDGSGDPVVLRHDHEVTGARFSPDGKHVVTSTMFKTAHVWRADGSGDPVVLRGHGVTPHRGPRRVQGTSVSSAEFSPDGRLVVTASEDETARVWRADGSGDPVVLRGHEGFVRTAKWSPDGQLVVTASRDETVRIWRVDGSGDPVVLRGHEGQVYSAVFSPDGRLVASASDDWTVRIWRADGGGEPLVLRHDAIVTIARWSPDGRLLATAAHGGMARVWRADGSGDPLVLRGHQSDAPVNDVAFSPDGKLLVTAADDETARIWQVDGSGDPLVLRGHDGSVDGAMFSPDGRYVVTASKDGTARVWLTDPAPLVSQICRGAGRNLTPDEWSTYVPDRLHRETCGPYLQAHLRADEREP